MFGIFIEKFGDILVLLVQELIYTNFTYGKIVFTICHLAESEFLRAYQQC